MRKSEQKKMLAENKNIQAGIKNERKQKKELQAQLNETLQGARQVEYLCRCILASVATKYGEPIYDDDKRELIGYRLEVPDMMIGARHTLHAKKDENGNYIVAFILAEDSDD